MCVDIEPCCIETPGQRRTLGMKVRNTSPDPIAELMVLFEWENEQHQPNADGSRTVGGWTSFIPRGMFAGTLAPGKEQIFYLDERDLEEEVMGRVAALSPGRYWVSVRSGEQELARYAGNLVGGVLEGLGLV